MKNSWRHFQKNYLIRVMFALTLLLVQHSLGVNVFADHIPENLVAKGKSEKTIAGIKLMGFTLKRIKKFYGNPTKVDGDNYYWNKSGVVLHVMMAIGSTFENGKWVKVGSEYIGYVEISGKQNLAQICKTGAGLSLGATVADVRSVYGKKYQVRRSTNRQSSKIFIEWKDGVSMEVYFDNEGKINKLSLNSAE